MPNKLKIVLSILAIVAIFLVFKLAQYVNAVANQNSTFQQTSPLPATDEDADHDGLNNQQEVIWGSDPFRPDTDGDGFKDGEEVNSGHNPLIPGPDDLINADNLTEKLSELTLYGLAAGALDPTSKNYEQSLANIADTISDSSRYVFGQEIEVGLIQEIPATPEAERAYFKNLRPISTKFGNLLEDQYLNFEKNLEVIGNEGFNASIKSYYSNQTSAFDSILEGGLKIKVPKTLSNTHRNLLNLVLQMKEITQAVQQGDKDPVKASLAYTELGNIPEKYLIVIGEYLTQIDTLNLDIKLLLND